MPSLGCYRCNHRGKRPSLINRGRKKLNRKRRNLPRWVCQVYNHLCKGVGTAQVLIIGAATRRRQARSVLTPPDLTKSRIFVLRFTLALQ